MMVQALPRADQAKTTRIGFTVTKKLGGAVVRNGNRRRLREAVRLAAALHAAPGHDYVVVGRRGALDASFATILNDLEATFGRIHAARASRRSAGADRAADEALR